MSASALVNGFRTKGFYAFRKFLLFWRIRFHRYRRARIVVSDELVVSAFKRFLTPQELAACRLIGGSRGAQCARTVALDAKQYVESRINFETHLRESVERLSNSAFSVGEQFGEAIGTILFSSASNSIDSTHPISECPASASAGSLSGRRVM